MESDRDSFAHWLKFSVCRDNAATKHCLSRWFSNKQQAFLAAPTWLQDLSAQKYNKKQAAWCSLVVSCSDALIPQISSEQKQI